MSKPIRVLVVDDSAVFRTLLTHVINADPDLTVVGQAADGEEAVRLVEQLDPDVVTMDMHMPRMNGAEATAHIMRVNPRPVVVVSASIDPSDVKQSFRALEAGAVSILAKPQGSEGPEFRRAVAQIVNTVKVLSQVKVVRRRQEPRASAPMPSAPNRNGWKPEIVAVGASTGGPAALEKVLSELPADFSAPIVIVQHIAEGFDGGLAEWLNRSTSLDVRVASTSLPLRAGQVLLAPCNRHLTVSAKRTFLDEGHPVDGHRPSITQLFRSVARSFGPAALGVLLTGMGADGAQGLLEMKRAGALTLVQDEPTSIVYGMGKQAVTLGAAEQILPLPQIGRAIGRCAQVTEVTS